MRGCPALRNSTVNTVQRETGGASSRSFGVRGEGRGEIQNPKFKTGTPTPALFGREDVGGTLVLRLSFEFRPCSYGNSSMDTSL